MQRRLLAGPGDVRKAELERPACGGGILLSGCQSESWGSTGEARGRAVRAGQSAFLSPTVRSALPFGTL